MDYGGAGRGRLVGILSRGATWRADSTSVKPLPSLKSMGQDSLGVGRQGYVCPRDWASGGLHARKGHAVAGVQAKPAHQASGTAPAEW